MKRGVAAIGAVHRGFSANSRGVLTLHASRIKPVHRPFGRLMTPSGTLMGLGRVLSTSTTKEVDKLLDQIASMNSSSRARVVSALLTLEEKSFAPAEFDKADLNKDGYVTRHEFYRYLRSKVEAAGGKVPTKPLTSLQLRAILFNAGLPMIGFGFMDNALMITFGDLIDATLGTMMHISTMAAAGLGNTLSDTLGLGLGGMIESAAQKFGLPPAQLTPAQAALPVVWRLKLLGSIVGLTIGCLLGMFPLLFFSTNHKRDLKQSYDLACRGEESKLRKENLQAALSNAGHMSSEECVETTLKALGIKDKDWVSFKEFKSIHKALEAGKK